MKLVVFCLFAVYCCSLVNTSTTRGDSERRKLQEVLDELDVMKDTLQHSEQMLNTPPKNIEDCCCLSALQCFRVNLQFQFNVTERNKLYKSLKHPLTRSGLKFCNTENSTSTCQDCASHPKEKAKEFFNRLRSLIERAISKLSMNGDVVKIQ